MFFYYFRWVWGIDAFNILPAVKDDRAVQHPACFQQSAFIRLQIDACQVSNRRESYSFPMKDSPYESRYFLLRGAAIASNAHHKIAGTQLKALEAWWCVTLRNPDADPGALDSGRRCT
jgi:hypothetical protein